jgi:hypothetical protein
MTQGSNASHHPPQKESNRRRFPDTTYLSNISFPRKYIAPAHEMRERGNTIPRLPHAHGREAHPDLMSHLLLAQP